MTGRSPLARRFIMQSPLALTLFDAPLTDPLDNNNIGYGIINADSTPASKVCVCGRHRANAHCHNVILQLPFGRWAYTDDPDAVLDFDYTPLDFDYLAIDG